MISALHGDPVYLHVL